MEFRTELEAAFQGLLAIGAGLVVLTALIIGVAQFIELTRAIATTVRGICSP